MASPPDTFLPVAGRPGWYKTRIGNSEVLEAQALQLQAQYPLPVQVACGLLGDDDGHSLFYIDQASAIELARAFATGSHNAGSESAARAASANVCDELSRVFQIAPFRPYFFDAAGYKARFIDQLTEPQARAIEEILTVGLEGYVSEETPESADSTLVAIMMRENAIRLWWD